MKQVMSTPENLRHLLIQSALAVVEGKLTPAEANAISNLSAEIHKSVKLEYVGRLMGEPMRNEQLIEVIKHAR